MRCNTPQELLTKLFNLLKILERWSETIQAKVNVTHLVAHESVSTEFSRYRRTIPTRSSPAGEGIVQGEEVRIFCGSKFNECHTQSYSMTLPILKEVFWRWASCSLPKGVKNGDLELRLAAIVSAGSRQPKTQATKRNLPRWTSVGSLLKSRPMAVIS